MDFLRGSHPSFSSHKLSGGSLVQWSIAVIVSVILWVAAISTRSFNFTEMLALLPPELPETYIVIDGPVSDSISVTFSGEGIGVLLDQVFTSPTSVQWGWPQVLTGENYPETIHYEFTSRDISYSRGSSNVGMISFLPQSVTLTVDRQFSRTLPVRAVAIGNIPSRYYWTELSDDSVEVVGAASVLSGMDSCLSVPVHPGTRFPGTGFTLPEGIASVYPASVTVRLLAPVPVIAPTRVTPAGNLY